MQQNGLLILKMLRWSNDMFFYLAPIALLFIFVLKKNIFGTKKILFVVLYVLYAVGYWYDVNKINEYAGSIRLNGCIKKYITLLISNEPQILPDVIWKNYQHSPDEYITYIILKSIFMFVLLFLTFFVLYRNISINVKAYSFFIFTAILFFLLFSLSQDTVNYKNEKFFYKKMKYINRIIDKNNEKIKKILLESMSIFDNAPNSKDTPIQRFVFIQKKIEQAIDER